MPAAVRYSDICTGHGCWPSRPNDQGSPDVYTEDLAQHRVTDHWATHCCPPPCHDSNAASGSPNVFANDLAKCRIGDAVACGSAMATGAATVFINDDIDIDLTLATPEEVQAAVVRSDERALAETDEEPIEVSQAQQVRNDIAKARLGVPTEPIPTEPIVTETPKDPPAVPVECDGLSGTEFPDSLQLSPNFTLGQVSTNTRVSHYKVVAQNGLTAAQIVCNLKAVCVNILEPLAAKYGKSNVLINSGFRAGESTSQHNRGEAVDVAFADVRTSADINKRAKEIAEMGIFDQFIFEQNRPTLGSTWYHLSFSKSRKRGDVRTKAAGSNSYPSGLQTLTIA